MKIESIEFEYQGFAVSGKNQQRTAFVRGRVMRFPDKRFKAWRAAFQAQAASWALKHHGAVLLYGQRPIFEGSVRLVVHYWPADRLRRDATGVLDAIFHACEVKNGGIFVSDDFQFKDVHFFTNEMDRANPRMMIRMEAI